MALLNRNDRTVITEEDRKEAEQYIPDVRALEPLLRSALGALPDFEHDLLVMSYGFRGEGFSCRTNTNFDAYSREKLEEHLRGARIMFAQKLHERLELAEAPEKTLATKRILKLLEGEE